MSITSPFSWYSEKLESSTFGGGVLVLAALIALVWANSPVRGSYETLSNFHIGPDVLHLNLSLNHWAADGLLAIFFFVVGLELKAEFVTGSLRDIRQALVPILAAVCGMIGPILFYVCVITLTGSGIYDGWAIPVATDIAFALAVLGLFGKGLPTAARTFLLTLAVVDDLLGIIIIAVFFAKELSLVWVLVSLVCIGIFAFFVNKRITAWYLLWPLALAAWVAMHASGVHATIAGVLLGLTVPAVARPGETHALTSAFGHRFEFFSAGIVLPVFAFFAAGVNVVDSGGFLQLLKEPVAIAIYLGLPIGKCIGIWGGTAIMTKLGRLRLGTGLYLGDIFAVSLVAGVGFTVSLLIATLSFDASDPHSAFAKVAVIVGSLLAVVLGAIALRIQARRHANDPSGEDATHGADLDGDPNN